MTAYDIITLLIIDMNDSHMGREAPEVEFSHNFRGLAGRLPPRSLLLWTWLRAYTIIMSNANFVQTHKPGHPL